MPGSGTAACRITASPRTAGWPWPAPTSWCRCSTASSAPWWPGRRSSWPSGTTWSACRPADCWRRWRPARSRCPRWAAAWTRTAPISLPRPRRDGTPRPCWAERPRPGAGSAVRPAVGAQDVHHEDQRVGPLDVRLRAAGLAVAVSRRDDQHHPAAHGLAGQARVPALDDLAGAGADGEAEWLAPLPGRVEHGTVAPDRADVLDHDRVAGGHGRAGALDQDLRGQVGRRLPARHLDRRGGAHRAGGHGGQPGATVGHLLARHGGIPRVVLDHVHDEHQGIGPLDAGLRIATGA